MTHRSSPTIGALLAASLWGCAPAAGPAQGSMTHDGRGGPPTLPAAPREVTFPRITPPPATTSAAPSPAPVASARPVSSVAPASTAATAPQGLGEYATKRAVAGCFCTTERDRIRIDIPCGVPTCVEGTWLSCAAEGRTITTGAACEDSAVCVCKIELDEDNAIAIACGMSACANGTKLTCSSDGRTERQGACD